MSPLVHAELAWLVAQPLPHRRDRLLVTAAGILPDLDALSLLGGVEAYGEYHHRITHGIAAAVVVVAACAAAARGRRLAVAALVAAAFHLHLLCDLVGSGPGWPLSYLWPLSDAEWHWVGQWPLASWQNGVIGLVATLACLAVGLRLRRTVVEVFSPRGDAAVVRTLWRRFRPAAGDPFDGPVP